MNEEKFLLLLSQNNKVIFEFIDKRIEENNEKIISIMDKKFEENNEKIIKVIGESNNDLLIQIDKGITTRLKEEIRPILDSHENRISQLEAVNS